MLRAFENSTLPHHAAFNAYRDQVDNPRNYYVTRFASGFPSGGKRPSTIGNLPKEARFDCGLTYHLRSTSEWNDLDRHVAKHFRGGLYTSRSGREENFSVAAWERQLWQDVFDLFLASCLGALAQLLRASQEGKRAELIKLYSEVTSELNSLRTRTNANQLNGEMKYVLVPRLSLLLLSFLLELRDFGSPQAKQLLDDLFSCYLHCPKDQLHQLTLAIEINPAYLNTRPATAGRTIDPHGHFPLIAIHLGRTSPLPFYSSGEAQHEQAFGLQLERNAFSTAYLNDRGMLGEWQTVNMTSKGNRKGFISKMRFIELAHLRAGLPYSP
ncbi:hypothetical protein [Deinococcus gobiensis]|nr:hypothetical protein [Deinococcus gobiensis]